MPSAYSKTLNIALFPLNGGENTNLYWDNVILFAQASADDLKINLNVVYNKAGHRRSYVKTIESILKGKNKPDAFIAASYLKKTTDIIELAERYQVPLIMFNNDLPKKTIAAVGPPRSKYKYFIGQVMSDDQHLGYVLADHLIKHAQQRNKRGDIQITGISGTRDSPESHARNQGLINAIAQHDNVSLKQIVFSDWQVSTSYRKATSLISRYQELDIIWCASDLMALSSLKAITESNRNIVSGGIDWSSQAIHSIKNGQLTASSGGHFTTAGYALVLLYDYLNGKDFSYNQQSIYKIPGGLVHQGNIDKYFSILTTRQWQKVDFTRYSRVINPQNTRYDFSFERLLLPNQPPNSPVADENKD